LLGLVDARVWASAAWWARWISMVRANERWLIARAPRSLVSGGGCAARTRGAGVA
jgi:hypothetical protein